MITIRSRALRGTLLGPALLALGCINISLPGGVPEPLVETVLRGSFGPKILLVSIDGVLQEGREPADFFGITGESRIARLREELDTARQDAEIGGLLLRINSPGGTVTASEIIYEEIRRFKRERGVPVVAQLMGVAASGGYYVAMAADEIVAYPTTVTGSIGVLANLLPNLTGLMDKLGIQDQTLTTGAFKNAGSPLRSMRPEERAQLQSVIDDLFARFLEVVENGRSNLTREEIERLADGRIYSAAQAKAHGLVDHIGDLDIAIARVEASAGAAATRLVRYHRPREYRSNVFSRPAVPPTLELELLPRWPNLPAPGFLYLWAPGS